MALAMSTSQPVRSLTVSVSALSRHPLFLRCRFLQRSDRKNACSGRSCLANGPFGNGSLLFAEIAGIVRHSTIFVPCTG
jgi:hypothetical protein